MSGFALGAQRDVDHARAIEEKLREIAEILDDHAAFLSLPPPAADADATAYDWRPLRRTR